MDIEKFSGDIKVTVGNSSAKISRTHRVRNNSTYTFLFDFDRELNWTDSKTCTFTMGDTSETKTITNGKCELEIGNYVGEVKMAIVCTNTSGKPKSVMACTGFDVFKNPDSETSISGN